MKKPEDIIRRVCGDVEQRLRACRSRQVAEMLKDKLCQELQSECKSEIVQNFLTHHVDRVMNTIFDKEGNNRLIDGANK